MNLNFCRWALLVPALACCLRAQSGPAPQQSQETPQAQQTSPAKPAPAKTTQAQDRTTNDGRFSVELFYWDTAAHPSLRGMGGSFTALDFPGQSNRSPGGVLSFPAGHSNTVRVSYFRTRGSGATIAGQDLVLFTQAISNGDYLQTSYNIQNVKISYDYLTYPNPPESTGFRLKTLWEVQYTNVKSVINAPLAVDSSGSPAPVTAQGSLTIIYPTLGIGFEQIVSPNFRIEGKASGFGFPSHAVLWDADASGVVRVKGVELVIGYRAFHFRTSPQNDQHVTGTLSGAFVGLRWGP